MCDCMIIAISGVPGVGKTQAARQVAQMLRAKLVSITRLLEEGKIPYKWDHKRRTKVVSQKDVQRAVDRIEKSSPKSDFVIEGHLSHLLRADFVFVLRCKPSILRRRLAKRKWNKAKIEENAEAEMLDIITSEALAKSRRQKPRAKVYEIDTTSKTPTETAKTIMRILSSKSVARRFRPGRIRWLSTRAIGHR